MTSGFWHLDLKIYKIFNYLNCKVVFIIISIFFHFFNSCGIQSLKETPPDKFIQWSKEGNFPKTIAILPFKNYTDKEGIEKTVRESFYRHFSIKSFRDLELFLVDKNTGSLEKSLKKDIKKISPEKIAKKLNCDGVIFGEVNNFKRIFAGVYSQIAIGARIQIYALKREEFIFECNYLTRFHAGGIPFSPFGFSLSILQSGMNLRERQLIRAADDLCRHLSENIKDPFFPDFYELFGKSGWIVQIASFKEIDSAVKTCKKLNEINIPVNIKTTEVFEEIWHRLIMGPYDNMGDAENAQKKAMNLGFSPFINHIEPRF
ncbi:MAG: SPOR domain-containing protein [Thermodesulfobacteriota bacterium]|nr:SPOR domain-containing protein [Thermodesulfobacteriota bacterium]